MLLIKKNSDDTSNMSPENKWEVVRPDHEMAERVYAREEIKNWKKNPNSRRLFTVSHEPDIKKRKKNKTKQNKTLN